jgi:hypothetical protein
VSTFVHMRWISRRGHNENPIQNNNKHMRTTQHTMASNSVGRSSSTNKKLHTKSRRSHTSISMHTNMLAMHGKRGNMFVEFNRETTASHHSIDIFARDKLVESHTFGRLSCRFGLSHSHWDGHTSRKGEYARGELGIEEFIFLHWGICGRRLQRAQNHQLKLEHEHVQVGRL